MPRKKRATQPENMPMTELAGYIARLETLLSQAQADAVTNHDPTFLRYMQDVERRLQSVRAVQSARLAAGEAPDKTTRRPPAHIAWMNENRRLRAIPTRLMGKAFPDLSAAYAAVKGLIPSAVNEATKELPNMPDMARVFAPLHEAVARCEAEVTEAISAVYMHNVEAMMGDPSEEEIIAGQDFAESARQ